MPEASHWLPHIHHGSGRSAFDDHDPLRAFRSAFRELALLAGETVPGVARGRCEPLIPDSDGAYSSPAVAYPPAVLRALRAVWSGAVAMVKAGYEEGRHDGSRILVGLATGEVSVAKFNDLTADERRAR